MRVRLLLLLACLLAGPWAWSQRAEISEREHRHYSRFDLQDAIKRYTKALEKDPENGEILFNLANCYRLNSEYALAEQFFRKASSKNDTPLCKLYFAQMLLANGNYAEAGEWFMKYSSVADTPSGIKNATVMAEYCAEIVKNGLPTDIYDVQRLPFNSEHIDFSPAFLGNSNQVIFASTREDGGKKSRLVDGWTAEGFVDLFYVERDADSVWSEPKLLPKPLNSKYHEGPLTFSTDYSVAYITRSDNDGSRGFDTQHNTRLHIYQLQRNATHGMEDKKHWQDLQPIWFNNSEYSSMHPTLSQDGNIMVLASDKPGGLGGMDLYVSFLEGGKWSEPKNLGDIINTSGNEAFPYIHPETNNLYFSSNLHVGFGGLDIFKALWNPDTRTWEHPVNIGLPVNSSADDFGIAVTRDLAEGYFTSNRDAANSDDIYYFKRKPIATIAGTAINAEDGSVIPGATVVVAIGQKGGGETLTTVTADANGRYTAEVPFDSDYHLTGSKDGFITNDEATGQDVVFRYEFDGQSVVESEVRLIPEACELFLAGRVLNEDFNTSVPFAEIVVKDACTGQQTTVKAGEDGSYRIAVKKDCDYELSATREGFKPGVAKVSTKGKSCQEGTVKQDVILDFEKLYAGMVIELEHIYYDFDKYFIRTDAQADLEHLYKLLMEYPDMKGEIGAHTDSRGSFRYNDVLSENRAKAAVEWLIAKGIARERLTWKGYGEYKLRNQCSDGVACDDKAHQRNRRVEFRVTYYQGQVESKEAPEYRTEGEGR
jgi:outer membrane protein OmpA-like peptidoglycan-associated protein